MTLKEQNIDTIVQHPGANIIPVNISSPNPSDLLRIAIEKDADIDKLEKLMELQERWEEKEAKKAYTVSMMNFRADCPTINKSKKGFEYKYAPLAETIEQIKDILIKYGFSYRWATCNKNNITSVKCIITHVQGHSEETSLSSPCLTPTKRQNPIQAMAATVSYLERYTLYAILGLTSKEMDADGGIAKELINESQIEQIKILLEKSKSDVSKFLRWLNIKNITQISQGDFESICKTLNKKIERIANT